MRAEREKILGKLTPEELRELGRTLLEKQPGLVFDVLRMLQCRNDAPPANLKSDLPWCKCGNCRDMPTKIEQKCCEQEPEYCISTLHHFSHLCLDNGPLSQDSKGAQSAHDLEAYRNAAYGRFVAWKYGPLGPGNRVPIPSCCVWRVRDKFPDPRGQYTGFIPSPQKYNPEEMNPCRIKPPKFD
ncbi:hypothetical protein NFI96_021991 [Prochilodus magdalenae]|nr:hypothetical protein NFI96_021991 [Prochilodus magdalenae]